MAQISSSASAPRPVLFVRFAAIVTGVQAVALGWLASAGFFYQDDIDYTAQADRPLTLGYLLEPNNDHLAPGLRLAYWLVAHAAPYENWATVAVRVLVQAVATMLFARLLVRLYGPGPVALAALAGYATAVLTLPSFLSLSSAVNLLPSHVAAVLLLDAWVRHQLTGRLRHALVGAGALLLGVLFWEKMALVLLVLPLLSISVLTEGPARDRLRATAARWRGLLVCAAPAVAFGALYLARRPGDGPDARPGATDFAHLAWDSWGRSVAPTLLGGPWRWFAGPGTYVSVADPPVLGIVAGQLAVAGLLLLAVRRNGWWGLAPWSMPAVWLAANVAVLGIGRYDQFGTVVGRTYHYLSDLTVPLVLAVVTSLVRVRPEEVAGRVGPVAELPAELPAGTRPRPLLVAAVLVYVVGLVVTVSGFQRRWVDNPTRGYLDTAVEQLRAVPGAQVFDTPVSNRVLTLLGSDRRLSQVLGPLDLDVRWDGREGGEPKMLDDSGRLVDASFVTEARTTSDPTRCTYRLDGVGILIIPLDRALPAGDRFVRVDYLASRGSPVEVRLGSAGSWTEPLRGRRQDLRAPLAGFIVQTAGAAVDRVMLRSDNIGLNLCVSQVTVGIPVPA